MIAISLQEIALLHWKDGLEILILAVGIYYLYLGLRGTRGLSVLTGLAVIILGLALLSQVFGLAVISWLLRSLSAVVLLALVVIFQPELRRMLANLGSSRFFGAPLQQRETAELIADTAVELSNKHLGALIAIEGRTDIQSQIESGVELDCKFSPELVVSIFYPKTPLHDGALIVRGDRIASAACIFPVSQRQDLDRNLGLRHRAAIGLTEESDAVVIIVSEETGIISLSHRGRIERDFTPEGLRQRLSELLLAQNEGSSNEEPRGKGGSLGTGDSSVGRHQTEPRRSADDLAA
jgi:diadenylate cyclase